MKRKEKDSINVIILIAVAVISILVLVALFTPSTKTTNKAKTNSSWDDPGMSKTGSSEWPSYGKTTGKLINELNKEYENYAVTLAREKVLYDKIGGMYPGRRAGPRFYDYDFLEVPISMTIVINNGQRYYLTFQKGGVKEGDSRLYE